MNRVTVRRTANPSRSLRMKHSKPNVSNVKPCTRRTRPLRYDWLADWRQPPRHRELKSVDARVWLLMESENRRGPGCQLSVETMARRLTVSDSTIKRSLRRWRRTNLFLEFRRYRFDDPLPKLRLTFHPFDPRAIPRARTAIKWHGKELGFSWQRGALVFLENRTARIQAARLAVRQSLKKPSSNSPPSTLPLDRGRERPVEKGL